MPLHKHGQKLLLHANYAPAYATVTTSKLFIYTQRLVINFCCMQIIHMHTQLRQSNCSPLGFHTIKKREKKSTDNPCQEVECLGFETGSRLAQE